MGWTHGMITSFRRISIMVNLNRLLVISKICGHISPERNCNSQRTGLCRIQLRVMRQVWQVSSCSALGLSSPIHETKVHVGCPAQSFEVSAIACHQWNLPGYSNRCVVTSGASTSQTPPVRRGRNAAWSESLKIFWRSGSERAKLS